jgi:beta-xylosidase
MINRLRIIYNNVLIIIVTAIIFHSCLVVKKDVYISTSFREPANEGLRFIYSDDGLHWDSVPGVWLKPEVGSQKVLRDPSIVRSPDGYFHMVWTTSWKGDLGFGYTKSKDLMNWLEPRMIPVMKNEPTTINVWAPEIFYDDIKKEFIVVWSSCVPGKFSKGIEDEDNNHRLYYVTTKDFKTISETKLLLDPGFSCIDATIVKRGKFNYVLVFKDNTRPNRNLKVAFAKSPTGPYYNVSDAFTDSYTEGPTVEKNKKDYIVYYDAYRNFNFGASKTRDFIHFTDITNEVTVPKGHKHGTIFRAPGKLVKNLFVNYDLSQNKMKSSDNKIISEKK